MSMINSIVMFAQDAAAQAAPAAVDASTATEGVPAESMGGGWSGILVWVLVFAGLWFLMFMPQRKRAKEQQKMQASLTVGDQVVTAGGIYGKIVSIDEQTAVLEVEQGRIKFVRQQIVAKV